MKPDKIKRKDRLFHYSHICRVLNSTAIAITTRKISRDMDSLEYYLDLVDIYKTLHPQLQVFLSCIAHSPV